MLNQQNPRQTSPYPAPVEFRKGMAVVLALEPYRSFLSQLSADCVDNATMQVRRMTPPHDKLRTE